MRNTGSRRLNSAAQKGTLSGALGHQPNTGRFAAAAGRDALCRTSRRTGWDGRPWRRTGTGTARIFPVSTHPAIVLAEMNTSPPILLCRSNAVFWSHPPVRQAQRVCAQSRPIFYSLPRRRVMLGTAWIDRPVDTQGRAPCFHVLLSAAWKHGHAQANDRHSSRVFAMPPRGFARTTRNG